MVATGALPPGRRSPTRRATPAESGATARARPEQSSRRTGPAPHPTRMVNMCAEATIRDRNSHMRDRAVITGGRPAAPTGSGMTEQNGHHVPTGAVIPHRNGQHARPERSSWATETVIMRGQQGAGAGRGWLAPALLCSPGARGAGCYRSGSATAGTSVGRPSWLVEVTGRREPPRTTVIPGARFSPMAAWPPQSRCCRAAGDLLPRSSARHAARPSSGHLGAGAAPDGGTGWLR